MSTFYWKCDTNITSFEVHNAQSTYPFTCNRTVYRASPTTTTKCWIVPENDITPVSGYGAPYTITVYKDSAESTLDNTWDLDDDNYIAYKSYDRYCKISATKLNYVWSDYSGSLYEKALTASIKCTGSHIDYMEIWAYSEALSTWYKKGQVSTQASGSFSITLDNEYSSIDIKFMVYDQGGTLLSTSSVYTVNQSAVYYDVTTSMGNYIKSVSPTGTTAATERTGLAISATASDSYWGSWTTLAAYSYRNYYTHSFSEWSVTSGRGTFGYYKQASTTFYPEADSTIKATGSVSVSSKQYKYVITYDGNGATSGSMESQELTGVTSPGDVITIATRSNGYTRTGYSFVNFNTKADGTGTTYYQNTSSNFSSSVTLYAQWRLDTNYYRYRLKYDYNGGTKSAVDLTTTEYDPSSSGYYRQANSTYTYTCTSTVPYKNYYTCAGWSADGTTSTTIYTKGSSITIAALAPEGSTGYVNEATLKAVWLLSKFYWDGNTGSQDWSLIRTGQPVSNITAARWNTLNNIIKIIDSDYVVKRVSAGGSITATDFMWVYDGIDNLPGHGTLPTLPRHGLTREIQTGDEILASYFYGSASIQSALNTAIDYYNGTI